MNVRVVKDYQNGFKRLTRVHVHQIHGLHAMNIVSVDFLKFVDIVVGAE